MSGYTDTWPTKREAAAVLGVSVRTIERYCGENTLDWQTRTAPGRRPEVVIEPRSLDRAIAEKLDAGKAEPQISSVLRPEGAGGSGVPETALRGRGGAMPAKAAGLERPDAGAIYTHAIQGGPFAEALLAAIVRDMPPVNFEAEIARERAFDDMRRQLTGLDSVADSVVEPPIFVSIEDAAIITGLSEAYIRRACRTGKLESVRDRGYRIHRARLEAWAEAIGGV